MSALSESVTPRPSNPLLQTSDESIAQVDRISRSDGFRKSERLRRFLQFTVERTLAGDIWQLRENVIAREVFDRPASFDPRVESIVRVEAKRLRRKLDEYYRNGGADDPVLIAFRTGSYVPEIRENRQRTLHSPRSADLTFGAPHALAYSECLRATRDLAGTRWKNIADATSRLQSLTASYPEFALAHAALADAYLCQATAGMASPSQTLELARVAAERSCHLDQTLPHAITSLASVRLFLDRTPDAAIEMANRAVETMPHFAPAHVVRGMALGMANRGGEALSGLQRAVELAPLSSRANCALALAYASADQPDQAQYWFEAAEALNPGGLTHVLAALHAIARKDYSTGEKQIRGYSDAASSSVALGVQGACAGLAGDRKSAARVLGKLEQFEGYSDPFAAALIHHALGDEVSAWARFRESTSARSPMALLSAPLFFSANPRHTLTPPRKGGDSGRVDCPRAYATGLSRHLAEPTAAS